MEFESNFRESWLSDDEESGVNKSKSHQRKPRILDSDSEDESGSPGPSSSQAIEKTGTDSKQQAVKEDANSDLETTKTSKSSRKGRAILDSSDEESNSDDGYNKPDSPVKTDEKMSEHESLITEAPWRSMLKGDFYSFGASSDEEGASSSSFQQPTAEETNKQKTKGTKKSKSRTKPGDEVRQIHSETQRMTREAIVSLPYHKPKQRSLTEFLNRRRTVVAQDLKPKSRELDLITKTFMEREKEAEELFKSDSEGSDKDEPAEGNNEPTPDEVNPLPSPSQQLISTNGEERNVASPQSSNPEKQVSETEDPKPVMETETVDKQADLDSSSLPLDPSANESVSIVPEVSTLDLSCSVPDSVQLLRDSEDLNLELEEEPVTKSKLPIKKAALISAKASPQLTGKPGEFITFGAEKKTTDPSLVNDLVSRFMKHARKVSKSPEKKDFKLNIVKKVKDPNGQEQLQTEIIELKAQPSSGKQRADAQPGALLKQLKDNLKSAISAKRQAERRKKMENEAVNNEETGEAAEADDMEPEEEEEEILSDEPDTEVEEDEEEGLEEEDDDKTKLKQKKNKLVDEEAEEDEDECKEEDFEEEKKEELKSKENDPEDQSFEDKLNMSSSPNLDRSLSDTRKESFPAPRVPDTQENMNELLGLCSGDFETQKEVSRSLFGKDSQNVPIAKSFTRIVDMDDEDDNEDTTDNIEKPKETEEIWRNLVVAEDLDNIGLSKKKKQKAPLYFSDEEDEEREENVEDEEEEEERVDDEDNEELREFRRATEYFEDEAELSGSDAGSGDERDEGDDYWEKEAGDDETFDEDELREQVERAHLKTLLDQDQRDVRLMQELFLEDGDLHSEGGGRLRQFRWRNTQLDENEENPVTKPDKEDAEAEKVDNEDEAAWRKLRHEREKWLREQQNDLDLAKEAVGVSVVHKRKIQWKSSSKAVSAAVALPQDSATTSAAAKLLEDSPQKAAPFSAKTRGSFLRRAEKDLMVIANLAKSSLPIQGAASANNFVFASITPERAAQNKKIQKRPTDSAEPAPKKAKSSSGQAASIFSFL